MVQMRHGDADLKLQRLSATESLLDKIIEMKQPNIDVTMKHTCKSLNQMVGAASTTVHWVPHDEEYFDAPGRRSSDVGTNPTSPRARESMSNSARANPDSWVQPLPAFPMTSELTTSAITMKKVIAVCGSCCCGRLLGHGNCNSRWAISEELWLCRHTL